MCRRLKKAAYDIDVIVRCVESGGVTDAARGATADHFCVLTTYLVSCSAALQSEMCSSSSSSSSSSSNVNRITGI